MDVLQTIYREPAWIHLPHLLFPRGDCWDRIDGCTHGLCWHERYPEGIHGSILSEIDLVTDTFIF